MSKNIERRDANSESRRDVTVRRRFLAGLSLASGCFIALPAIARILSPSRRAWVPDGSGWRARIGVLTPADDAVPESEFWTMAPDGVSVHAARVPLGDLRTYSDPPGPDKATELLAGLPLHSIVFAFTTTSYLLGTNGERELTARLEKLSNGIPVLLPTIAAAAAFRAFAAQRIALFHPPWFADDVVEKGVAYFQNQGFEVVHASHLTPAREVPHPNLGSDVTPAELYEWVRKHAPSNMECAFIAGNGFRAIGVIAALEEDLGRPVLTGNQVAFWYALRLAGVGAEVDDYGQVFRKNPNRK
jgi:maleate isomerase